MKIKTMWLVRNWLGLLMLLLCLGLTVCGILIEMQVPFASLPVLLAAGVCLTVFVIGRYVPLDFGSYAPRLREHALSAYRLWRNTQQPMVGQLKYENERTAFDTVTWLFGVVSWPGVLYRDMSKEEEAFWCAYMEHRKNLDDAVLTHDRAVKGLYEFLRERRTTQEDLERSEMRVVLKGVEPA